MYTVYVHKNVLHSRRKKVHHSESPLGITNIGKIKNIFDSTCKSYIHSLIGLFSVQ